MIEYLEKQQRNKLKDWFKKLGARYRLYFGFCPHCNSDAPQIYSCTVCAKYIMDDDTLLDNSKIKTYPVNNKTKEEWYKEWKNQNNIE